MPGFNKGGTTIATPFGKNEFLRSTGDVKYESYTVAAASVPAATINGASGQKILQPGTVMAKILTGADAGKIGPFQRGTGAAGTAAVNEVQTITRTSTGGTVTFAFNGSAASAAVSAAATVTAAQIQAALEGLTTIDVGDVTVAGSAGGPFTVTFSGQYAGVDVPMITVDNTLATGGTVTVAQTTQGAAAVPQVGAATDGRGDPANIVGLNATFLPWQLIERDCEVAVAYEAVAIQAWCFEMNVDGTYSALSNLTVTDIRNPARKGLRLAFK